MSRKIEFGLYCQGNYEDCELMYGDLMVLLTPLGYLSDEHTLIYKIEPYSTDHYAVELQFFNNLTTVAANYPALQIHITTSSNSVNFNLI